MFSQKVLTVALPITWDNNSHLSLQCIDWSAIKLAIKLHKISKTHHSPTRHVWIGEAKIGHRYNNNKNDNLHVSICIKDYFVKKRIRLHLPVRKLKIYDLINNK